jgi:hypothetical protein
MGITSYLTPRSRTLLEKLMNTNLVKKFIQSYDTRRFITVVTDPSQETNSSSSHTPALSLKIHLNIILFIVASPLQLWKLKLSLCLST